MSLRKKTLNGLFWVGLEKVGLHTIQLAVFIVLARLLTPEDFGLVGMIMILFSVSSTIIDGGINQAIIREKELIRDDLETAFTINVVLGFFLYSLLYLSAPSVSEFYGDSRLTLLIRIMGLAILFKSWGLVYSAILIQKLDFKKELYLMIPAHLASGFIAILLAFKGFGVISLAVKFVVLEFLNAVLLFIFCSFRVSFGFDKNSLKKLIGFGFNLSVSKILTSINSDIYKAVIGKVYSASILGLYTQSQKIKRLISVNIISAIQKVTYPALAKIRDDKNKLKETYKKIVIISCLFTVPLMTILIITADPLIPFLLGEQWRDAIPILQIIAIGGMIYNVTLIHQNLLKVLNRTDVFLKLEVIQVFNFMLALFIGVWFDIYVLLYLIVVVRYINTIIYAFSVGHFIEYPLSEQFKDIADIICISILTLLIVLYLKGFLLDLQLKDIYTLVLLFSICIVLFVLNGIIFRTDKLSLIKEIVLEKRN